MKFSPTRKQIASAQDLKIALDFYRLTKKRFSELKKEILKKDIFHYDKRRAPKRIRKKGKGILRDPRDIEYLRGLHLYGNPRYGNTEAFRFFTELAIQALAAGFIYADQALDRAEQELTYYRNAFIRATYKIHGLQCEGIVFTTHKQALANKTLRRFTSFLDNDRFAKKKRTFYEQRLKDKKEKANNGYSNNEESFKKFQGLRQFFSVEEYVNTIISCPDEIELFEGVEGILMYEKDKYLFQIKKGGSWVYDDFQSTSCRYMLSIGDSEIVESNRLETIERALFKQFLIESYRLSIE